MLFRSVVALGDIVIGPVVHRAREQKEDRRAVLFLLRKMIIRGSERAVEQLARMALEAPDEEVDELVDELVRAATESADRGERGTYLGEVRPAIEKAATALYDSERPRLQEAALVLRDLNWEQGLDPGLVGRVITGNAPRGDINRLRNGDARTFQQLEAAASSPATPEADRRRAIRAASRMYSRPIQRLAVDLLWDVYAKDEAESVRRECLAGQAQLGKPADDAHREQLTADFKDHPGLRDAILGAWSSLFRHAPRPEASDSDPRGKRT